MTTKYKLHDPFPDEFHQGMYPILEDGAVPRPKLAPDLEQELYFKELDRSDRNSLPWLVQTWLLSILPAIDLLGLAAYLKARMQEHIGHEEKMDPLDPMPQPPEIIHGYLQFVIERTSRRDLKLRWGEKNKRIMDYQNFLTYRIEMRRIACARLKEERRITQGGVLEHDAVKSLSPLLLPSHVTEKSSCSTLQGPR
ncbi:MAG: hypothetical protein WAX69_03265 [Victivallales bacterium]